MSLPGKERQSQKRREINNRNHKKATGRFFAPHQKKHPSTSQQDAIQLNHPRRSHKERG